MKFSCLAYSVPATHLFSSAHSGLAGDDERNDDEEYADDDAVHKMELEDKIADGSLFAPHGSAAPVVAAPVGVSPIMASSPASPVLSPSN
jgi:hypothetical protein